MCTSKALRTIGLSLATALTALMLLGIDSLAQPDAPSMSTIAHVESGRRVGPGT